MICLIGKKKKKKMKFARQGKPGNFLRHQRILGRHKVFSEQSLKNAPSLLSPLWLYTLQLPRRGGKDRRYSIDKPTWRLLFGTRAGFSASEACKHFIWKLHHGSRTSPCKAACHFRPVFTAGSKALKQRTQRWRFDPQFTSAFMY